MNGKIIENQDKINIREYKEDIDMEFVKKLEKNCDQESKQEISMMFTHLNDEDPLRRIRLYPLRVMLVAELLENGELVGVIRGCIKCVGTGFGRRDVKLGCILGLRVCPKHRRIGIGSRLVEAIEEWMIQCGAKYTFLATEEKNVASKNLFALKYNYIKFCSLAIYVQPVPICSPSKYPFREIKIVKFAVDEAISFYDARLGGESMLYPSDIGEILKAKLSFGTWLCYSKENIHKDDEGNSIITQNSWLIFSIWNTCETYKYQKQPFSFPPTFKFLYSTLNQARKKIFPCLTLKMPFSENSVEKTLGFLFVYGVYGEGDRLGELMDCVWSFASSMATNLKGCNAIMLELGVCDPIREHVPQESCASCIEDLWYIKKVKQYLIDEEDELTLMRHFTKSVFVDPRDI